MVRISGGLCRGRRINVLADGHIRPTTGRVREALFSILAPRVSGATVLDLFAGCGLLGLESLSRGAKAAFFVEIQPKAVQSIKKNIILCSMEERCGVFRGSAVDEKTWAVLKQKGPWKNGLVVAFDLILLDPPYGQGLIRPALSGLGKAGWVKNGAVAVAEHEAGPPPALAPPWYLQQTRRYGHTCLTFWQWQAGPGQGAGPFLSRQND